MAKAIFLKTKFLLIHAIRIQPIIHSEFVLNQKKKVTIPEDPDRCDTESPRKKVEATQRSTEALSQPGYQKRFVYDGRLKINLNTWQKEKQSFS